MKYSESSRCLGPRAHRCLRTPATTRRSPSRACCKARRISSTIESLTFPGMEELIRPHIVISAMRIGNGAWAAFNDNFPEARHRLFDVHSRRREPVERCHGQQEIDEYAGTKRHEEKNTQTAKFTISHNSRLKLPENEGPYKRFSRPRYCPANIPFGLESPTHQRRLNWWKAARV